MRGLIIVLALIGAALAVPKNGQRIVGGSPTTIQTYPFTANMNYLVFNIFWSPSCAGTVLTTTSILSAAHCYFGDQAGQWNVRLGSTQINSGGSTHQVSQLVIHQNYDNQLLKNDVAIVRLATPAVYSNSVQSAFIAGPSVQIPDGYPVIALGWGTLYSNGPQAQTLQHVTINVINQELCAERYAYLKTQPGFQNWPDIDDGMICTGILNVGGKDACQGDSGGPVVLSTERNVVAGITSWGYQCAHEFYPGVNARVSHYTSWILNNAN